MKTHSNHIADNPDFNNVNQFIAQQLLNGKSIRGYGKSQHGMNGKDADLDSEGQCVIEEIVITDPVNSETMFVELHVYRYVSICTPTDEDEKREEALQAYAEFIVMDANAYSGEWTGSDYWSYSMNEVIRVPLSVEEYENADENLDTLAERCATAVYNSTEGKTFEKFAADLNKAIDDLHELTNEQLGI